MRVDVPYFKNCFGSEGIELAELFCAFLSVLFILSYKKYCCCYINSHNITGLCAYLLGRIRFKMLVNGGSLFSCCLCLWGFRDFGGNDRNNCSNPYVEVSSEITLLLFFVCEFLLYKVFPISAVVVSVSCLCTM